MLTCVQEQFQGSSREIEQQLKQYEARTLNKLSNVNAWLKGNVVFLKKIVRHIVSSPLIQDR